MRKKKKGVIDSSIPETQRSVTVLVVLDNTKFDKMCEEEKIGKPERFMDTAFQDAYIGSPELFEFCSKHDVACFMTNMRVADDLLVTVDATSPLGESL